MRPEFFGFRIRNSLDFGSSGRIQLQDCSKSVIHRKSDNDVTYDVIISIFFFKLRLTHTHTNPAEMSNYMNYLRAPLTSPAVSRFVSPFLVGLLSVREPIWGGTYACTSVRGRKKQWKHRGSFLLKFKCICRDTFRTL